MTDIAKILALPPKERDDEIRKLIVPKPWKHRFINEKYLASTRCLNCGVEYSQDIYETPCPIPDLIALGWELAKQMLIKLTIEQKTVCKKIVMEIFQKTKKAMAVLAPNKKVEFDWWLLFCAEPTDYILAAIMAGEYTE